MAALRVDAHQHFWDPSRREYPWMGEAHGPVRRAFGPEDLRPELARNGIDRTVLVQCLSSLDETREYLATAAATDFIAGVVGWIDLTAPDAADTLAELRAGPHGRKLVGIRHQVHDEPDPEWLLRSDVQRGLRAVEAAGLAYDLLVRPRELPAALETARRFPGLRLVVDHLAKPPIRSGEIEPWATLMAPFRELPHVACKVSGMITEADWATWQPNDLVPYVRRVLDWFGEDRLMFGSDWPPCLLAGSYDAVAAAARHALGDLSPASGEGFWGGNAVRFYGLEG